ncbi:MAG: 50S ribosomal protein L10 [Spirochaetia bacterium]|nr:50S ribosomal protein L10 [Spirochaetia bacterium]
MALRAKKTQPSKVEAIGELATKIAASTDFVFAEYRGMTVEQITSLRKQLRAKNAEFHVVKNNFARIAFEQASYPQVAGMLVGPTAVAFAKADSNEVAKIIAEFAKENPVKLKGGLVEKDFLDAAAMDAYAKLPGKNTLIAMLMSVMRAPVQNLVYTLKAVEEQKAGQGGAPAKAEAAPVAEAPAAEAAPAAAPEASAEPQA